VHKKRPRLITLDDFDFFFRPRREIYVKYVYTTQLKTEREKKNTRKKSEESTSPRRRRRGEKTARSKRAKFDVSIQGLLSLLFSSPTAETFRAPRRGRGKCFFLLSTISGPAAFRYATIGVG
jgi:hypothetical protein